jgi:hypothetical protein
MSNWSPRRIANGCGTEEIRLSAEHLVDIGNFIARDSPADAAQFITGSKCIAKY